ncbi:MAG: 3-deoxy-D-manno-octulosonic acid transferase [Verrucomicrobiae bacterium]|nr:3-deoxy-D-manno-octulosonic acid transferase [Verrucomicrobiae bacterium]
MRLLYTILYTLGFVLLSPGFLYKMWKRGKYRENFTQRFGCYSPELRQRLAAKPGRRAWLQAVSVGEVNIALLIIAALRERGLQVVLTTTTSTGYALARERLPADVTLLYFPQDFPAPVRRAYDLIAPDLVVLMESEIWPNHVWEAARRRVPVFLINARMSPRSARRHAKLGWLFRSVFANLTLVCAQSAEDAANFRRFGAPRVELTGNLKYDASLPQPGHQTIDPRQILRDLGVAESRPVLVAGSTHPGEEDILFDLLKQMPEVFLVLVPRHVERTPEIIELAKRKGVVMTLRKNGGPVHSPACLLVNTTGELKSFYRVATVIFVGKSLVGIGGQNIVEAAASGHPVICGPNMQNFKAITAEFLTAGAVVQVQDPYELQHAVRDLGRDEQLRAKIVTAAQAVIARNVGATQRTIELMIAAQAAHQVPRKKL